MEPQTSQNIIYPEKQSFGAKWPDKKTVIALVIGILLLAAVLGFGILRREATPPVGGDASIQAGFFTVSQIPGAVKVNAGDERGVGVQIFLRPVEGFREPVYFEAEDVFGEGRSVKDQNLFQARFLPHTLTPENFDKPAVLIISADSQAKPGQYVITYRAQASSVKKNFRLTMIVE